MTDALAAVLTRIDRDTDAALDRLKTLLRIPSVSTDPAHDADTGRAADWLAGSLTELGFDAASRATTGHPIVVGHHREAGPDAPHVLYYGHYDVQPPDPLDLWEQPPFEPRDRRGRARTAHRVPRGGRRQGSADDLHRGDAGVEDRARHASGERHRAARGRGRSRGSPSLDAFLEANRDELSADVCVVTDTGMWDIDTPAITYMLRGLVYVEVTLHGPSHDLHSGMFGGSIVNPINALCKTLGALIDDDGVIQIPGFYDDVHEQTDAERAAWRDLGFDEAGFLGGAGLKSPVGEVGYSTLERVWSRPTCDVNGIVGGYTGEGAKTVIGAWARAKLSCRLVAHQDPQKVYEGIVRFFEARTPPDCRWSFEGPRPRSGHPRAHGVAVSGGGGGGAADHVRSGCCPDRLGRLDPGGRLVPAHPGLRLPAGRLLARR